MITVTDDINILSPSARADLSATPTPFAASVVFRDVGKTEMESAIHACGSASPSAVCIGVNPKAHFATVYYGIDVAGPSASETIKKAGNQSFKAGDWAQGTRDILVRADAVSHSRSGVAVINKPMTTVEHPVSAIPFVIGFGILGVFVLLSYLAIRKQRAAMKAAIENSQREAAEMASRNIKAGFGDDPKPVPRAEFPRPPQRRVRQETMIPVPRYTPAPVTYAAPVVIDRGGNDFTTGLILGQALSQPTRVVEREIIREEPRRRSITPEPERSSWSSSVDSSSVFNDSSSGGGSSDFGDSGGGGGSTDW